MALARQGLELRIEGTSDLAWGSRKVSGNAQRRRKNFILFHGTLLLSGFDRNLLGTLLTHPARQPDWRAQRLHEEFVDCLNVDPEQFQADWTSIWGAEVREDYPAEVVNLAREFVRTKYTQKEWNESL
jgi:lipoate-protein ligase A